MKQIKVILYLTIDETKVSNSQITEAIKDTLLGGEEYIDGRVESIDRVYVED